METQANKDGGRRMSRAARGRWTAIVVLASLGAMELGLRAAGYSPRLSAVPDQHFGWVLLPNQRTVQDGRAVVTNALGFYGEGVPMAAGERKGKLVAVLGSSLTVGPGVTMPEAWPAVLEALLDGSDPSAYQVASFAVSGYGSQQMSRVYDAHIASLRPEVLVVEVNSGAPVPIFFPADPNSRMHKWLARSAVYDAWTKFVTRDRGARMAPATVGGGMADQKRLLELYRDPLGEAHRKSWLRVEADLDHLSLQQHQHGGRLVVLAAPMLDHWLGGSPTRPAEIVAGFGLMQSKGAPALVDVFSDWSPIIERWVASCERMGFTREGVWSAIGTGDSKDLWSSNAPPYLVTDPMHWSAEGHKMVAEALAEAVE